MTTVVINPNGTVTVTGPNTVTPNQAPVAPAANTAPVAPAANTAPVAPAANTAPVGNNAGQGQGVVIINPNNPTPAPQPVPAPIVAGPTTFVAQQTVDGGNRVNFPNWVIWIIVSIFLLLLAFGGYTLYQSGKDAEPAKTETPVVKIVNSGGSGSKNAIDPKAREMAQEAQDGVEVNSQRISVLEQDKQIAEFEAENNKKTKEAECQNRTANEVFY